MPRAASGSTSRPSTASVYDALVDGVPLRDVVVPTIVEGLALAPSSIALSGAEVELVSAERRDRRLARLLDDVSADIRLDHRRWSTVARAAHGQCAHGSRCRAHPDPVRVLRPRRTDPTDCHHQSRPRQPQPGSRDQRRRDDDVRRPDQPVRGGRERGSATPGRQPCTRRRSRAASGSRRRRATGARSPSIARTRVAPRPMPHSPTSSSHEQPPRPDRPRPIDTSPSRQEQHDRQTRTPERTRPRTGRPDPAAHLGAGPDRSPAEPNPAESAPAAPTVRRGRARGARGQRRASTASCCPCS